MRRLYLRCNESPGGRFLDEPIIANVRRRFAPRHIGRLIAGFALGWYYVWGLGALLILCSNDPNNTLAAGVVAFGAITSASTFAWWLSRRSKGSATRLTIQDDRVTFESGGSIARASVISGAVADLDDQRASVAIQTKTERWLITVPKHAAHNIEATLALGAHNAAAHFSASESSIVSRVAFTFLLLMPGFAMLGGAVWSTVCAIIIHAFGANRAALEGVLYGAFVVLVVALPAVLTTRIIQGGEFRISALGTYVGAMSSGPPSGRSEAQWQNMIDSSLRLTGLRTSGLQRHALAHLIAARSRVMDPNIVNCLNDLMHGDRLASKPYRTSNVEIRSVALDSTASVEARALAARILIEGDPRDPTAAAALALLPLRLRQRRAILFGSRDRALKALWQLRNWDPATLAA